MSKREKTLSENIIVIAVLGILMTSFVYYFFKDEQRLTHTGFDYVAQNFSSRVVALRAQWFMDKLVTEGFDVIEQLKKEII